MLSKLKIALAFIGAVLVAILAAFFKGRSDGKADVEKKVVESNTKAVEEVAQQRVDNVKAVNDVKQKAIVNSDSQIDSDLNDKWTRG